MIDNLMPKRFKYLDLLFRFETQKEKHEFQESLLQDYLKVLDVDISNFLEWFESSTSFGIKVLEPTASIKFGVNSNYEIDSYCDFFGEDNVTITTSRSMWIAVDDLMHRLMCNADVLSADFNSGKRLYKPLDIIPLYKLVYAPVSRYFDYKPQTNPYIEHEYESINQIETLSLFYYGIPKSEERKVLARLMSHILMTWIYTHEHLHYFGGHLHYLNDYDTKSIISEFELLGDDENRLYRKGFEYEADMQATISVFASFVNESYYEYLPDYCQGNEKEWIARVVLVSCITGCMIMQKSHEIKHQSDFYPKAITRILTIIFNGLKTGNTSYLSLKFSPSEMVSLCGGILNDSFQISDILYTRSDSRGIKDYDFSRDFKSLDIFKNLEDLEYLHELIMNYFKDEKSIKVLSKNPIYERLFEEYWQLNQFYDNEFIHTLKKYRIKSTKGESMYGEK